MGDKKRVDVDYFSQTLGSSSFADNFALQYKLLHIILQKCHWILEKWFYPNHDLMV